MSEFDLYTLEGFIPHDYELLVTKLGSFAMDGLGSMHVVADSDDTLVVANRPISTPDGTTSEVQGISSWEVIEHLLPENAQEAERRLYEKYHPRELDGTLTPGQAMRWLLDSLRRQKHFRTSTEDLPDVIQDLGVRPRDGTVELFGQCNALGIPVVILSAGVGNVGEIVARDHDIRPDVVVTNWLVTNPPRPALGRVVGWSSPPVHPLNKYEKGHHDISKVKEVRPNTILIGNDANDPKMVEGESNVVRIHVMDKVPSEEERAASKEAGYDTIVVRSIAPVGRFIELLDVISQVSGRGPA